MLLGLSEEGVTVRDGATKSGRRINMAGNKGMTIHEKPVSTLKTEELSSASEKIRAIV